MKKLVKTIASQSQNFPRIASFSFGNFPVVYMNQRQKNRLQQVLCSLGTKTSDRKTKIMSSTIDSFLYDFEREEFLNRVVTGDETWDAYMNTEAK